MDTAKIFENGTDQTVVLPKQFRLDGDEVFIRQLGKSIILIPKSEDVLWETFMDGLGGFSDDFMKDGRSPEIPSTMACNSL